MRCRYLVVPAPHFCAVHLWGAQKTGLPVFGAALRWAEAALAEAERGAGQGGRGGGESRKGERRRP